MSATLVTTAAAGWYHDPSDSGSWRWWDGAIWTSHVRPKEHTTPIAVAAPVSEAIVLPVQPAPAPQIPQPAQPIQPIQPVSLTPETPASEQEYWHSPNAEVVQIPGRSATTHGSHFHPVGPGGHGPTPYAVTHEWGDVGSPQTAGIWLLAFLPIMSVGLQVVFGIIFGVIAGTTGVSVSPPTIVFSVILLVLAWVFAGMDVRALAARNYDAPKIWWMLLLPPLVYFIVRGRVVRREGKRAWPPELLFFCSILGFTLIVIGFTALAMSFLGGMPSSFSY